MMVKKVAMVHAASGAIPPMQEAFQRLAPGLLTDCFLDEGLLAEVNRHGGVHPGDLRKFLRLFMRAAESDCDCILICCSIFCSYRDLAAQLTEKPVIAITVPMLERAVQYGGRIGIIATTPTSGPHTQQQIQALMPEGQTCEFEIETVPDAIAALRRGDTAVHDALVAEAAARLDQKGCSCIILSQITMARAKYSMSGVSTPVLTSPEEGVQKILELNKV